METPWKVFGFEKWTNENGEECVRLYVARPLILGEGSTGEGTETQRLYYKRKYVNYDPKVGHLIIAVDGRYGIGNIYVVGEDSAR